MAEMCCDVVSESEVSTPCEPSSQTARRRRMEIRRLKCVAVSASETENEQKRQKLELPTTTVSREWCNAVESSAVDGKERLIDTVNERSGTKETFISTTQPEIRSTPSPSLSAALVYPKVGMASVCGRRRDMEDAVAIRPFFRRGENENPSELHYYAVYDGHGCSHVATSCRDRLHELVGEELENDEASTEWKNAMTRSFNRMDKEAIAWNQSVMGASCRCELQTPECDAVGSTAVVAIVTPEKIIVANCGDSRAVLCRNGKPVPLSADHKPDRPDELSRIQAAGGRVIYWDGPRVLGVLAMSRAIGDNYLKPYVSCEPEVTVTDRTADDECLILASDGLWDVVSNETACGVARMCLGGRNPTSNNQGWPERDGGGENGDKGCSDASMLLTKLALARRSSDNVSVVVIDLRRGVS